MIQGYEVLLKTLPTQKKFIMRLILLTYMLPSKGLWNCFTLTHKIRLCNIFCPESYLVVNYALLSHSNENG